MQERKAIPLNLSAMKGVKISYPNKTQTKEITKKKGKKK